MAKTKNMIEEITNQLNHQLVTLNELKGLQKTINNLIQLKQPALQKGQICTVDHNKTRGSIGIIKKVNRTKCKIDFGAKGIMNVPKTMIELV